MIVLLTVGSNYGRTSRRMVRVVTIAGSCLFESNFTSVSLYGRESPDMRIAKVDARQ
jgi:hypothetical protein